MKKREILARRIIPGLLACLMLTSCTIGIVNREEFITDSPVDSPISATASPPVAGSTPESPSGQTWYIETVDGNGRGGGSLALDSCGYPHISYQIDSPSGYQDITYAWRTGGQWTIDKVAPADLDGSTALALDGSGYPHVAHIACNMYACVPQYARWTGSEWDITEWGGVGKVPSLAIDANGHPHASYSRGNVVDQLSLEYTRWTGSDWLTETVDSGSGSFEYSVLRLDSSGYPRISYCGADDLRYARWTGDQWVVQIIDDAAYTGQYTSLALDDEDDPHISYYDWTSKDLKYAVWTGSAWNIQTVDSAGSVGRFTSLALDTYGHPHIAYHDDTNRAVKYARWVDGEWQIEIVERNVGDGDTISLALDGENQPHISYYYYGGSDDHALKYATTPSAVALSDITCVPVVSPITPSTAVSTPAPTPSSAPPQAVATEEPGSGPIVRYFRADVDEVEPGGTVVLEWETVGATKATIYHQSPDDRVVKASWAVDVTGDYVYEIDPDESNNIFLRLDVEDEEGRTASEGISIKLICPNPWFFSPEPFDCPTAPVFSDAAEQHFEHGTMIWISEGWTGEGSESWVVVLYDDEQYGSKWMVYPDEWGEDDPDRDPTLTPPAGLYQPTRGFGLVWRQNSDVRDRIGWAVDQEAGFRTIMQVTVQFKYNSIYLRALDGNVWHLFPERSGWEKISVEN